MVTDSYFEYANKVVNFLLIVFKNGIFELQGDSDCAYVHQQKAKS